MESVLSRYRNLIILVGVLFLQILGLAMQVKRGGKDAESTRLIRVWVVGAISPLERALVWAENTSGDIWHNYFYLRGVRAENRQLKEQIEQMRLEQVRLSEDAAQARRLQTLLAFKEQYISKTVAAQVIGSSGTDSSRVVYIDKGESAGLRRDMAVITADGIVGKLLFVYPSVSQVLLIDDQSSGVGVILGTSRLQGVLAGTSNGEVVLNGVMSDEQVPVGETVLTSGGDQIFPKGLPVGTVTRVGNGKDLFLNIKVKPAANLSKLEEVLVLVEKQERQATATSNAVRAADILAQRLPSVPDKPATNANGTPAAAAKSEGSTKPVGSTKPEASATPVPGKSVPVNSAANSAGIAPAAPLQNGKKAPGTADVRGASLPGIALEGTPTSATAPGIAADQTSAQPKTVRAPGGAQGTANPDDSVTKPNSTKPKPDPQSNPQSPADDNNPH